jgi:hypothetical protein
MRKPIVAFGSFCLLMVVGAVLGRAQTEKHPPAAPLVTDQDLLGGLKNP